MFNLVKLEKWDSDTTPSNIFDSIYRVSSLESCQKFWGIVPLNRLFERSRPVRDERLPKDTGIGPEIELFQKESLTRFLNTPSSSVKWPWSWEKLKSKISSLSERHPDKLSKISDISWLHLLYENLSSLKLQRLPNDRGNFPPSSFPDKSILMADVRFPMALEIVPCKLLERRMRNSRRLKLYYQLGIVWLK